ncbi:hypothetical protein [Luteipulveratus mongoliensis]|uniref:Uncharacterized protein n=1 Tax=Luteipulveratus mongoliensis TaxID=571913 RepID=A0A0K1JGN6_9MICO|nr:hypothetical protein [Luteipulveratus mongoliensis]AKU15738.1 hypothetical protein VV02_07555 [Luteipulveratus mongoliensis]
MNVDDVVKVLVVLVGTPTLATLIGYIFKHRQDAAVTTLTKAQADKVWQEISDKAGLTINGQGETITAQGKTIKGLEERVEALEQRHSAERHAWKQDREVLVSRITHMETWARAIYRWLQEGANPPPPDTPDWVLELAEQTQWDAGH